MAESADTIRIEREMAEWLAHPMEFGVEPVLVRYTKTHKVKLITLGDVEIHVVEYAMPDGSRGRGFVNGPLTWSFIGDEVNAISDEDHFVAYCGWSWLFPAMQAKTIQTEFVSESEEAAFAAASDNAGVVNFRVTSRYKIGTSELFEYDGVRAGVRVKGAGNIESKVEFPSSDPCYFLPPIYFSLGQEVILPE